MTEPATIEHQALTKEQIRALRWLGDNPSFESEWLCDGKPIKKQPSEKWNQFKISGPTGSLILSFSDMKAIKPFIATMATPDKMYSPNDLGRAALASAESQP